MNRFYIITNKDKDPGFADYPFQIKEYLEKPGIKCTAREFREKHGGNAGGRL